MDNNIIVITPSQLDELITSRLSELKDYLTAEIKKITVKQVAAEEQEDIMDINEVVTFTRWSKQYIYTLCSKQLIPHYKKGKRLYFRKSEIRNYLCSERVNTMQDIERKAVTYTVTHKRR